MNLDYLKTKKESISVILLGLSAFLAVLTVVKIAAFFVTTARAENLVKNAVAQSNSDSNNNDVEKLVARSKAIANELKRKNLFAPPPPKQHPVTEVSGILGNEVIINGKFYKLGDKVGDAKIVAIEPTQVRIEWDGREKVFTPILASSSAGSGGPRPVRKVAKVQGGKEEGAGMVVVEPESRPMGGGFERGGFFSPEARARMRERWMNMSEEEREEFRARMRERFGGRGPGGRGGPAGRRGPEGRRR